jgi:polyisoprenoid-binding protein YceI
MLSGIFMDQYMVSRRLLLYGFLFFIVGLCSSQVAAGQSRYEIKAGSVFFKSDAPLELIQAGSKELKGLIDFDNGTFAFSVSMISFQGFNSQLQREHFNENYMETEKFPKATFSGRMIESPNLSQPGEYTVRAKGKLVIHGVEQERIIKSTVRVSKEGLAIQSSFTILLQEHDITIPKVVQQKIAEEIFVDIKALAVKQ